jgi:acetyl/propionyl-CoA carboxylase alpha subunit
VTVIRKLLVANRAEIAARVIRTARALGVGTVAVFSDADAEAPYVALAHEAVRLPGSTAAQTYLDADAILAAALRTGCDAVHPGYGFLSEHAGFARAATAAGLTFVGPTPDVIETMGSKVGAKAIAIASGVPVLPDITISDGDDVDPTVIGTHVGYPLLVKASAGGGGRGMRIVTAPDDLPGALQSARSEATAAFGDGTLFVERLVGRPRHVEVQILGDTHGNLIHLFERDCSIQRRHQKIVEEAPAPSLGDELRGRIGQAAIALARAVGYTNAGTVEFLVEPDGSFWFLEMNTRLQVEHPVTEMITGLDLVALQLLVARGEALPEVVLGRSRRGHAIEVRLYAEDVAAGFLPTSGRLDRLRIPTAEHVRVDAGYADGDVISTHYDAMLAKIIAWAPTREEAARRLAGTLAATEVHGVTTNRDLLLAVLRHPEFLDDAIDTGFLERHDPTALAAAVTDPSARTVHALAAVLAAREDRRTRLPLPPGIPSGWRNVGPGVQEHELLAHDGTTTVVAMLGTRAGERAAVDGVEPALRVHRVTSELADLEIDGHRIRCAVQLGADRIHVDSVLGATSFRELPRFPETVREEPGGSLRSPIPGTVVRVEVEAGAEVTAGTVLVALEAMKMEHMVRAPHDGRVATVHVAVGDQVAAGAVLVALEVEEQP